MSKRYSLLSLEQLETRLALSLPATAPSLGAPPPASSTAIWVNSDATLQSAVNNLQSGQTIVLQKGTYNLSSTLYVGLPNPVQNVTIRGATDNYDDVVLLGKGMENATYGNVPMGIAVYNAQNVLLADLSIGNVYYHPIQLQAKFGASNINIYHVHLFDAGEQFIKSDPNSSGGGVTNSSVKYSLIEYTVAPPTTNHGGGIGYTNGIDVHAGSGWVISNNLIRNLHTPDTAQNLWGPGILIWNQSSNMVVDGNTIVDCDRAIAFGLNDLTTGYDNQGGIIRNNFVYQTPGLFSATRRQHSDAQIVLWDSLGSQVYQNTVLTNGNSNDSIQTRWISGTDIQNNLADAPLQARDGGTFTQAGNYLNATLSMFVNSYAGDLHLVSNAATQASVIGQATYLTAAPTDFDGDTRPSAAKVDIGGDEYKAATSSNQIIDNGQTGYSETGTGWTSTTQGYNANSRSRAQGTGSDTAVWQFGSVLTGSFDVQVTWPGGSNRSASATYQIYDGATLLGSVVVNQQFGPSGVAVNGRPFQSLSAVGGVANISSGTLRVVLADRPDGSVFADAVRIVPVPTPTVDLNWSAGGITGPTSGNTQTPFTLARSYTISGSASPSNFAISYFASRSGFFGSADNLFLGKETISGLTALAMGTHTGTSPAFTVDADGPMYLLAKLDSGNILFETDETNNVTVAALPVLMSGPVVVDNGQWGYSETGTGWTNSTSGFNSNSRVHAAGTGANTAAWQVDGLTTGNYNVQVTWPAGPTAATNAAYQIYDGITLLATIVVNQQVSPSGTLVNNVAFQSLGSFTITSGTLKVVLSDSANGSVFADALCVTGL